MTVLFFALTFALSWGALLPFFALPPETYGHHPWLFGLLQLAKFAPTLAGVFAAAQAYGPDGADRLVRRLLPRRGDGRWILLAVFGPLALGAAATVAAIQWGAAPGPPDPGELGLFAPFLAARLLLGAGLGEELGWRGFALPRLQRTLRPVGASLLLGVIAAAWSWPFFHFGHQLTDPSFARMVPVALAHSVLLTWLYNRSRGSLLACALAHAGLLAAVETLERTMPLLWMFGEARAMYPWVLAAAALLLIAGTRGRLGREGGDRAP